MIVKTVMPATEKQRTWDILNSTPLIEYSYYNGSLFRLEFEVFE